MTIKINDATPNRPEGHRLIQAPVVQVNFNDFVKQLKTEKAWQTNDRNSITVYKAQGLTLVITALHGGAELNDLPIDGLLMLQVMEGSITVFHEGNLGILRDRQMLVLQEAAAANIKG
jgi:hypothetical protein